LDGLAGGARHHEGHDAAREREPRQLEQLLVDVVGLERSMTPTRVRLIHTAPDPQVLHVVATMPMRSVEAPVSFHQAPWVCVRMLVPL
jgi:hypothetical protein